MIPTLWIDAVGWSLVHFLWQGAIAAFAFALVLSRVRLPTSRYRLAVSFLCLLPILPVATLTYLRIAHTGVRHGSAELSQPAITRSLDVRLAVTVPSSPGTAKAVLFPQPRDSIAWVVFVWAAGASGFGILHFIGWIRVRRLAGAGVSMARDTWQKPMGAMVNRIGVRCAVRLLESTVATCPVVIGHLRPVILLPVSLAAGLTPGQIEMILAHELAHVRRCDFLMNLMQAAIEAALFYHPAVWWISRQVRREREACCDEIAIAACGGDTIAYARTLTDLEEWRSAPTLAVAATSAPIVARIRRLLGFPDPSRPRMSAVLAAAMIACTVVPLATARLLRAQTKPADALTTAIHILTFDGHPAAGARVTLVHAPPEQDDSFLGEFAADSTGTVLVPSAMLAGKHDRVRVIVDADGNAITVDNVAPTFRLSEAGSVAVTFVGPDGKPLRELKVFPERVAGSEFNDASFWSHEAMLSAAGQQRLSLTTDVNGTIIFNRVARGQRMVICTDDDRFAQISSRDALVLSQSGRTVDKKIQMVASATIRGTVRFGADGTPAAGVTVAAQGDENEGTPQAVTDAHGEYELRRLHSGHQNIFLELDKNGLDKNWTAVAYERLPVGAGDHLDGKDLTLIPGVVLSGTAVDINTGHPIPGEDVGIFGPANPHSGSYCQSPITDANGRFAVRVPPGPQYVYTMNRPIDYYQPSPRWVTVLAGQPSNIKLEFTPDPTPSLAGTVLRADGTPAVGAVVEAAPPPWSGIRWGPIAETDAAGHFSIRPVPNGSKLRVRLGDGGTQAPTEVGPKNRGNLAIKLSNGGNRVTIPVKITDRNGQPLAEATISIYSDDLSDESSNQHPDADGKYTFPGFLDETYHVVAYADGYNTVQVPAHCILPGGETKWQEIKLDYANGKISGGVVNGPKPWGGVRVEVQGDQQKWETTTDSEGKFHIDHLDNSNRLMLHATADWGTSALQEVRPPQDDVQLWFPTSTTRP